MTAWPIVFNFEPSSQGTPAIDIRQGNVGSYTIQAIPDPKYPNTVPADPITGVRILPPQPTVTSLTVSNVTNEYKIDTTIWQMQSGYTASVYFNSNDIFPFKQINLLLTDNTTRTFTTKAAVDAFSNSSSMPFLVTSCIPVNEQYVYRALSVTATSNSTTTPTLTRTFWIRMESDFTKTQDLLLALLGRSQSYIDSIAALNPPTKPYTPPALLPTTKAPASEVVTQSYTSIVNRNDVSEPDFVMDELFRKKDPSLDIALLEEKSGKDIISLIDQQLADVEVNMKEGIINNSIVPLSDIEQLLEKRSDTEDCCGCDLPPNNNMPTPPKFQWDDIGVNINVPSGVEFYGIKYDVTSKRAIVYGTGNYVYVSDTNDFLNWTRINGLPFYTSSGILAYGGYGYIFSRSSILKIDLLSKTLVKIKSPIKTGHYIMKMYIDNNGIYSFSSVSGELLINRDYNLELWETIGNIPTTIGDIYDVYKTDNIWYLATSGGDLYNSVDLYNWSRVYTFGLEHDISNPILLDNLYTFAYFSNTLDNDGFTKPANERILNVGGYNLLTNTPISFLIENSVIEGNIYFSRGNCKFINGVYYIYGTYISGTSSTGNNLLSAYIVRSYDLQNFTNDDILPNPSKSYFTEYISDITTTDNNIHIAIGGNSIYSVK